jgi:hypothetical protein
MELIEIIKSSLSIFSAVFFVFIIASYTIFKIKDRTRIKPYLRVNIQNPSNNLIIEERIQEGIQLKGKSRINNNADKPVSPSSIPLKPKQVKLSADQPARLSLQNRFKIINENRPIEYVFNPEFAQERPNSKIKMKQGEMNIYDHYSQTDEKMHKMKLAVN